MLPFIPRKVAKSLEKRTHAASPKANAVSNTPGTSTTSRVTVEELPQTPQTKANSKGKEKAVDSSIQLEKEYGTLLAMSMSDYALWSDAELRQTIEFAEDGFIPLVYLLDRVSLPDGAKTHASEAMLVKAIRSFASEVFDIRMLMSSPSRAVWYGRATSKDDTGGYEVRLKGWKDAIERAGGMTKRQWEEQTIYVENVPPQSRSTAGIHRLISSLLSEVESESAASIPRIQHISLPRHHQDKPTDQPKCKGFALVTLAHPKDLGFLLRRWPWQRQSTTNSAGTPESSKVHQDAARFGFRTTTRAHWEKLNAEYLAYRQRLLDQLVGVEQEARQIAPPDASSASAAPEREPTPQELVPRTPALELSAPYPPGCLAYVRNVHPETNKTTLRKLFAHAFEEQVAAGATSDGIDYVDFNKGMDTCHLRLATPAYTTQLAQYFSARRVVQTQGLDGAGSTASDGERKPLSVEVVGGEREKLYWGKVPEKVRRQAVEKAVTGAAPSTTEHQAGAEEGANAKRKRRRMK